MEASPTADFMRVQRAIEHVIEAAKVESVRLAKAAEDCVSEDMEALREAHLKELDTVQALLAALHLFQRRRPP